MSSPIRILQISDTHISHGPEFDKIAFARGMEQVNHVSADYTIHTGDVTNGGTRADYDLARRLLSGIDKKIIYIIGNHDARNVGYELFDEYFGSRESVFVDDRVLIAGFDSTIPDRDGGRFGAMHIANLKRTLHKEGDGRIKIVAFHHHLVPIPRAGRERSMISDAGAVLKVILDYNVDLVLNGHRHSPNVYRVEDTVMVNSGTMSHYKTRAGDYHSYNRIEIDSGKVQVTVPSIEVRTKQKFVRHIQRGNKLIGAHAPRIARIVHVSDTHFTRGSEFLSETFDVAAMRINQLKPDLMVHCGDLTHSGLPESFHLAIEKLSQLNAPKIVIPGTHDLVNVGDVYFERYFGTVNPIYNGDGFVLYGMNSSQFDEPEGIVGRAHIDALTSKLNSIPEKKVRIVASHHHLMPIPRTREKYPIEDAGDVLRHLTNAGVDMILTGHRHISYTLKIENTVVVNAGTLSSRRIQSQYGNTFNLIDILANGTAVVSEINVATGMRRILGISKLVHHA